MEYLPLDTRILYKNDDGNILHLIRKKTLLNNTVIGVDKDININVFDEKTMYKNIKKSKIHYKAVKQKYARTINFYKDNVNNYRAFYEDDKWYVYRNSEFILCLKIIKHNKKHNEVVLEYNDMIRKMHFKYTNANYTMNKDTRKYTANYKMIYMTNSISSMKNIIIKDNTYNINNLFELLKTHKKIYKIAHSNVFTSMESFIIGSMIILES